MGRKMLRHKGVVMLIAALLTACSFIEPEPLDTAEPTDFAPTSEPSTETSPTVETPPASTPKPLPTGDFSPNTDPWPTPTPIPEVPLLVHASHTVLPDRALLRQGISVVLDSAL